MPTDLTTAEKAARLGLTWQCPCGCRLWFDQPVTWGASPTEIDALYAERFPTLTPDATTGPLPTLTPHSGAPDYQAALEGLVKAGTRLVEEWNNINVDGPRGFADVQASIEDMTDALALARKVLNAQ